MAHSYIAEYCRHLRPVLWLCAFALAVVQCQRSQGWLSTAGSCAGEGGRKGSFDEHWDWSIRDCRLACERSFDCLGFEYSSFKKPASTRCELHKEVLTHAQPVPDISCFLKDTPQARAAWNGRIDVAQVDAFGGSSMSKTTYSSERQACVDARYLQPGVTSLAQKDMRGCNLLDAPLVKLAMDNTAFDHARLERAQFDESIGKSCTFNDVLMTGASLAKANFEGSFFARSDMSNADMDMMVCKMCTFLRVSMRSASLRSAVFQEAIFEDVDFNKADAEHADFSKAKLTGSKFTNARLRGSIFSGADVTGVDFERADVSAEELAGAINVDKALNLPFDPMTVP
uniref:Apple domain-containing protein n=1 Tax=Chrysotila carterae TaxID=13221 RepID=A0A7S4B0Q5_CHRCT